MDILGWILSPQMRGVEFCLASSVESDRICEAVSVTWPRVGLLGITTLSFSGLVLSILDSPFTLCCPIVGGFRRRTFLGRAFAGD